jgi:hypothetical protein
VTGSANGREIRGHVTPKGKLHLGDTEFNMTRETWGFSARQKEDAAEVVYFRRRD